jgi:hypothetical protein
MNGNDRPSPGESVRLRIDHSMLFDPISGLAIT